MGLFSKPEVVILKETSDAKEYLRKLEELQSKATGEVADRIMREIAITKAGIVGEENILFELKNSGMDLVVLQDILIEVDDLSAQIDFYVIASKVNFIIECKNLFGNLEINSKGDFIRTFEYGGKKIKEGIYSPITQNERHMMVLKSAKLASAGIMKTLAIKANFEETHKPLVVLANPKTVVNDRYAKKEVKSKVIRADQLVATIKKLNAAYDSFSCSKKEMIEIGNSMLKRNVETRKDYTLKYEELLEKIQNKSEMASNIKDRACPRCGNKLVLRVAKKGDNLGNQFYGCASFPKCRYIENA